MASNLIASAVIDKTTVPTLKRTLDLAALRQKITAGNIANAGSPGYRRRSIEFEAELKRLVAPERLAGVRTHARHLPIGRPQDAPFEVSQDRGGPDNGVNNVDVETEMVALARTQIWYQLGTTLARRKFEGLRLAIRGER